jgi:hypothetical protein
MIGLREDQRVKTQMVSKIKALFPAWRVGDVGGAAVASPLATVTATAARLTLAAESPASKVAG